MVKLLCFVWLILSLDFGILAPKSAEEEQTRSQFLKETKPDISFKVQDKLIPAHKQILMEESQYFANVFNSESKQEIIEVQDCESGVFISK